MAVGTHDRGRAVFLRAEGVLLIAGLLLVAVVLVLAQLYSWPQIADDAFIFFRYAKHLGTGEGLLWNLGEGPVEGFSSPLWVLILAAAPVLGFELVTAAKTLGVVCFVLTVAGAGLLTFLMSRSRWSALVASAVVALSIPLNYWAPSGMETSLYTCLLVAALCLLATGRTLAGAAVLGIVGIGRPEGPFVALVASAVYAVEPNRSIRWIVPMIALAPAAAYQVFRLLYFGVLFPNTYYAKVGGSLGLRLYDGSPTAGTASCSGWPRRSGSP